MIILSTSGVTKHFGTRTLLSEISFDIQEGEKVGLVGVNGCGKTALFRILTAQDKEYTGEMHISRQTTLGYVEQHVSNDSTRTAYEEVLCVFAPLLELEEELSRVTQELSSNPSPQKLNTLVRRQQSLQEQFEHGGGYTYRSHTRAALMGLGFSEDMLASSVSVLSGGEKAKVLLARMLLSGANFLLLDEPTNHLDIDSTQWLEDYLRTYSGAVIVVSHDRYFLDRVTSRTFEIENTHLTCYNGSYSVYMQKKSTNDALTQKHYTTTMREVHRLEDSVERFRRWNKEKSIKRAESMEKKIERIESTLEKPESDPDSIRFTFNARTVSGNDVISAKNLAKAFDGKPLFEGASFNVFRGERVFLLGPNGSGKTTLLKILLSKLPSDAGACTFGANVITGYYDQTQSGLTLSNSVIDEVWNSHPALSQTQLRNALTAFLFKGDDVYKPIAALSGGERARVALLKLMLSQCNLLLLDEPTNHLDIGSREALEHALEDYDGTLFIVSHDRYFINKMADRILRLTPSGIEQYTGNYDEYLEKVKQSAPLPQHKAIEKPNTYREQKEKQAEHRKLLSQLTRTETAISECEEQIVLLEQHLCSTEVATDYIKAMDVGEQLAQKRAECDALYTIWTELEQQTQSE